jgi:hypothetical protein
MSVLHRQQHLFSAAARGLCSRTAAVIVGFNLHFATLAKAEIMGLYKR